MRQLRGVARLLVLPCLLLTAPALAAEPPALIPRSALFGNPDRAMVRLSPDGKQVSYLAASDGVLNVWVAPVADLSKARVVTSDKNRGIRQYLWAYTNAHILYLQDKGGDENWRIYSVDLTTGKEINLTPFEGIQARPVHLGEDTPTTALVAINNRDKSLHDLYRVDITTGKLDLVQQCPDGVVDWVVDNAGTPRYGVAFTDDGGQAWLAPKDGGASWEPAFVFPQEDALTSSPLGFTKDNQALYLQDSRGRDTAALCSFDLGSQRATVLAQNPKADMADVLVNPVTRTVQAVSFNRLRAEWTALDPAIVPDLEYLRTLSDGELEVVSRSLDDSTWIAAYRDDNGPVKYYLYSRAGGNRRGTFLFNNRDALAKLTLAPMFPVTIPSRDGLELVSYLTLPIDSLPSGIDGPLHPDHPLPMVLLVHGGPWARDEWGFDPMHQLLANRGYAVLAVNYRGSTGFGKAFINAANREWGGKMHDDLIDAVDWAVKSGIADAKRVAIMGGSYGGYATLVGLTFTPDKFACGVDIVGPSNITTLLSTIPPYWQPLVSLWRTRVGDHTTPEGKAFLDSRSPLTYVDRIKRPLLIGQGANDPRVKQAESDQIVAAMQKKKIPVAYVVFPDEGHGFARPVNNMAFFGIAEAFLSQHLGGRYEPLDDAVVKSSAKVVAGAEQIPGLSTGTGK